VILLTDSVELRPVRESDLAIFFEQQLDPAANHMAAFTAEDPADRDAFETHWAKILADERITIRTILFDEQVAGHVATFERFDQPEVTYWLGKAYWGKGIASRALLLFLEQVAARPLFARVAKDNSASIRILEKCGFVQAGEDEGYASARGRVVEEFIFRLEA
jgi:RimJ/RimL family protein N-acetyltransferase